MTYSEQLLQRWNSLPRQSGYQRVDPQHPLELYVGFEAIQQKALLLVCQSEPAIIPTTKSIAVTVAKRQDKQWAVILRLTRTDDEAIFMQLCGDLIEFGRTQANDQAGVEAVLDRYRRWHRMLERKGSGLLSEAEQKGLLGELLFLQEQLSSGMNPLAAVEGWIGSEDADQDFVFPSGWHEVKTVGAGAKVVRISSLQQLDAAPPGELVVYFVDRTAPGAAESFTLNSVVQAVHNTLQAHQSAVVRLEEKLTERGYMPLREYDSPAYTLTGFHRYCVDQTFPRLTRELVPAQLAAATYELSLAALADWRTQ